MATFDKPDWVHHVLEALLEKKLAVIERAGRIELDLVETGGGAGSSTVIGPRLHREFCLPYDQRQHAALHEAGTKVVYHLCGGVMHMLDIVTENGADGMETMTPPAMGGDCDLAEANRRVGDRLFFIGGFDQNAGFEQGTPEAAAKLVRQCHGACPDGGYICSPSDHFFFGDPVNIQAFVDEANRCTY
jgi:uroporphyrinogen-III decarboxylase